MKEIPKGFKKMDLELTFTSDKIEHFEQTVLYFLVRDYYIFYTKNKKFGKDEFVELHFYCMPQYEGSISYRMGVYAQAAFQFHKKSYFYGKHRIHTVPDDFPACLHIEPEQ